MKILFKNSSLFINHDQVAINVHEDCFNHIQVVMDKCVEKSNHRWLEDDFTVKYDFRFIDDGPDMDMSPMRIGTRYYALDVSLLIVYSTEI